MALKGQKFQKQDENLINKIKEELKTRHSVRELARNIMYHEVRFLIGNNN